MGSCRSSALLTRNEADGAKIPHPPQFNPSESKIFGQRDSGPERRRNSPSGRIRRELRPLSSRSR